MGSENLLLLGGGPQESAMYSASRKTREILVFTVDELSDVLMDWFFSTFGKGSKQFELLSGSIGSSLV